MKKSLKLLFIFTAFVACFSGLVLNNAVAASASGGTVSWGVTPNKQERTPEVPANGARLLAANNGIFVSGTAEKKVWFSFDLGYEAGYTAEVLDILKQHNIKAVFFLCGNYLKQTELIGRMIDEGHDIGNHTDRHKDLPTLSDEGIKKDIVDFQEKFNEKYTAPLRFFRPPQGRFCERTLEAVNGEGLKTLMWSIAIVDWGKTPIDAAASAEKIASRIHPGALILLHITNSGTPEMLRLLLPKLAAKGYITGTPAEL